MILASHGIIASQIASFDADAVAFFTRVTTAGGTLSTTEKQAVNQLVLDLKANSLWTPMKAIYPMVGASAAACAQNLKSSSFTGTFSNNWTFASTGVTGNGTSAYMDTNLNTSTNLTLISSHLCIYVRNNIIQNAYDFANSTNSGLTTDATFLITRYNLGGGQSFFGISDASYGTTFTPNSSSSGFWLGSTNGSRGQKFYKNNSLIATGTGGITGFANNNLYLGAANGGGSAVFFSNKQFAFSSIGDGLTDTQASNFYTAVQAFQTTLSRQV